jgi:hypothetical protein
MYRKIILKYITLISINSFGGLVLIRRKELATKEKFKKFKKEAKRNIHTPRMFV